MRNLQESGFMLSCSLLARAMGTVLIFSQLAEVWYPSQMPFGPTTQGGSAFGYFALYVAASFGATMFDYLIVRQVTIVAMVLRMINLIPPLTDIDLEVAAAKIRAMVAAALVLRKGSKFRLDRLGSFLGCFASVAFSELTGLTIAIVFVSAELYSLKRRMMTL